MTTKVSSGNFSTSMYDYVASLKADGPRINTIAITDAAYTVTGSNILSANTGGYIKIIGSNFLSNTQVLVRRGAMTPALTITYISSSELRARVPASNVGVNIVYVVNYDGKFAANTIGYV
jgi:hypothetical protein